MISRQEEHFTQSPSGTLLGRFWRGSFGARSFRNHMRRRVLPRDYPLKPAAAAMRSGWARVLGAAFRLFEVVGNAQPQAGGVVNLAGRLLGILQLRQLFLDLGELLLNLRFQVGDLLLGHRKGV